MSSYLQIRFTEFILYDSKTQQAILLGFYCIKLSKKNYIKNKIFVDNKE